MTDSTTALAPAPVFEAHRVRGRFNSVFFIVMGPYLEWNMRKHKRRVFHQLPREVVELGSGVGANLRYLPDGATLLEQWCSPPRCCRAARSRRSSSPATRSARAPSPR